MTETYYPIQFDYASTFDVLVVSDFFIILLSNPVLTGKRDTKLSWLV